MKIERIDSSVEWLLTCNGLSYVRTLIIRNGEQFVNWKRNFDRTPEISNEILSNKELEERFNKLFC